jgi:hypothetical protein
VDFQTIYGDALLLSHHSVSETALLSLVKRRINAAYHDIWAALGGADPTFGRASTVLTTVDDYTTGAVTTDGTTTIIGSGTTFTSGMVGRKFKLNSWSEIYTISAFVSATEITLDKAINDDAGSTLGYVIYNDELSLPADCNDIVCLRQEASSTTLKRIGLRDMRSKQVESPFTSTGIEYNDPGYWAYKDLSTIIVYPAPTRVIGIKLDYTKKFTELSDPEDEPILPIDYHELLLIGGRIAILKYDDDPEYKNEQIDFERKLGMLKAKNAAIVDLVQIKLSVKRT